MENNIAECDVSTTVFSVDDTNKINDSEKRIKENQTGKAVVNKIKQNVFVLGDSIVKHILGNNKKTLLRTESLRETIFWLQS